MLILSALGDRGGDVLHPEAIKFVDDFGVFMRAAERRMELENLNIAEGRILETLINYPMRQSEVARRLGMDSGQLSRAVRSLKQKGLIVAETDEKSRRQKLMTTADGYRAACQALRQREEAVVKLLSGLKSAERESLTAGSSHFCRALTESRSEPFEIRLRKPQLGEVGMLIQQAILAHCEHPLNFDSSYEAHLGSVFLHCLSRPKEHLFQVAEFGGSTAGCVVARGHRERSRADVELLFVSASYQRRQIGRQLIEKAADWARQSRYWTIEIKVPKPRRAGRLFSLAGWDHVGTEPLRLFGRELDVDTWRKNLRT